MANPLSYTYVSDWVDYTDPTNVPAQVRVITAGDLMRYENAHRDTIQRVNEHDTLIGQHATSLTQLGDRTTSVETVNTAQGTTISQLTALVNQLQSTVTALNRNTLVRSVTTQYNMITGNRIYIHTGGSATYVLPDPTTSLHKDFIIHNKGAGTLTISSFTGNQIYYNSTSSFSYPIATQNTLHLASDGTHWVVLVSDSNVTI